jgi:hypothetical protein
VCPSRVSIRVSEPPICPAPMIPTSMAFSDSRLQGGSQL